MYGASSEARNAKSAAISAVVAWRRSGILASTAAFISGVYSASCMDVQT